MEYFLFLCGMDRQIKLYKDHCDILTLYHPKAGVDLFNGVLRLVGSLSKRMKTPDEDMYALTIQNRITNKRN